MNEVFANCSERDEINPLTPADIAEAQQADATLKHLFIFKHNAVIDQGWRSSSLRTLLVSANMAG
jgi:hypothetical protein